MRGKPHGRVNTYNSTATYSGSKGGLRRVPSSRRYLVLGTGVTLGLLFGRYPFCMPRLGTAPDYQTALLAWPRARRAKPPAPEI
jgi:hypothetical protein